LIIVDLDRGQQNGQQMVNTLWCEGKPKWLLLLGNIIFLKEYAEALHTSIIGMWSQENGYRKRAVMGVMKNDQP
jgi:hypothetical protein